MSQPLQIAQAGQSRLELLPALANRHGRIAGATGTGKTVTLQRLAQAFSHSGVPVFMADVKGDLSGLAPPGAINGKLRQRLDLLGIRNFAFAAAPVVFWDVCGKSGHPVRTTVSEMGPLLLARLLNLNDTQQGVLSLVFKIADDAGLLLLDMKDLRAMLQHVGDNARNFTTEYGNISAASVGAIQRRLLELDRQDAALLFGEPALDICDLMQTDAKGHGVVNVLAADSLMNSPKLYSAFLLWLLCASFLRKRVSPRELAALFITYCGVALVLSNAPSSQNADLALGAGIHERGCLRGIPGRRQPGRAAPGLDTFHGLRDDRRQSAVYHAVPAAAPLERARAAGRGVCPGHRHGRFFDRAPGVHDLRGARAQRCQSSRHAGCTRAGQRDILRLCRPG